jgi:hypothetical protein
MLHKSQKQPDLADASPLDKLREQLLLWDQLRAEIEVARLRIRTELDAHRPAKLARLQ